MTELYFCAGADIPIDLITQERLLERVPAWQAKNIRRRGGPHRQVSALAACTAMLLLCRRTGKSSREITVAPSDHGKPIAAGEDAHYSVSHSGGAFLVGISRQEIGVDIESENRRIKNPAERFFSPGEIAYINHGAEGWNERFLWVWTRKEAYIKRDGSGFSRPLSGFDTMGMKDIRSYRENGYFLACCCADGSEPTITRISAEEIIKCAMDLHHTNLR
ncbi:MAG: 4'-phosphopantetheinyl transferase superfamily protein [Oscillospiraceae bacterium]|nr:4'-phosphopantetheinyl transferase superfamily protein [Oscillospiraceae bacterium]